MQSLSVCITTYNEEENIGSCLESVAWADQKIVVDGQSTDKTEAIARKYTKNIYVQPNRSNLNINKNYGFSKAKGDWILCLDADERVTPGLAKNIHQILKQDSPCSGFLIPRRNYYFGRALRYGGHYPDHQLRLFRRVKGRFAARHVHERLEVDGLIGILEMPLEHLPYKTIDQYFNKFNFYTSFEAKFLYEKGKRVTWLNACWVLFGKHFFRGLRRYFFKAGFLDGWQGFLANLFTIFTGVVSYGKLWELQTNKNL